MTGPQIEFASESNDAIVEAFFANSCVLLRGFTNRLQIEPLAAVTSRLYEKLGHLHVYEQDMLDNEYDSLSSYVFTDKHRDLLAKIFGQHPYGVSSQATCARRVSAPNSAENWQKPLAYHIDAGFHTLSFTVNFWVPFNDCGEDSPSLAVVRAPLKETLEYVRFDGKPEENRGPGEWMFHHFNPVILGAANGSASATQELLGHFGERVWKPSYEVGDAMMISNYTLHGTHVTDAMSRSRESMELRFTGDVSIAQMLHEHPATILA